MSTVEDSPLGKPAAYADRYDPGLLVPVERAPQREMLGIASPLPFAGVDLWTLYELSWLDPRGKPAVAIALLRVPAESPRLVESKSLKLYLNSFSQTPFESAAVVERTIANDLGCASAAAVGVELVGPGAFAGLRIAALEGESIDDQAMDVQDYAPRPEFLATAGGSVEEALVSAALQVELPGHRPARLGQRPGSLPRAAHRSRRTSALPGLVPAAQRLSRALRRADVRRHPSAVPDRSA